MGRIVDKLDEVSIAELLLLLEAGFSVSHEGAGAIQIFTPSMPRHKVALRWDECKGGRFVVREMAKSA